MNSSFLKRYLKTLNRYKWVALATFTACMGVSGIMALQIEPVPKYVAFGGLTGTELDPSFSETTVEIIKQGQQFSQAEELVRLLLADNVIQAVANNLQVSPQQVRDRLLLKLPTPETSGLLQVIYRDDNSQKASQAVSALMQAMVQQSKLINDARLQARLQTLENQLPQARSQLTQAEQKLNEYYGGDSQELSRLEAEVTRQQETVKTLETALNSAKSSRSQIVSSLAIAQAPQVAPTHANQRFIITLGIGFIVGLFLSSGLTILLIFIGKSPNRTEFRQNLLLAYNGRCPITGCDVQDALEAVPIDADRDTRSQDLDNGLILRADIQRLFRAGQIAIDPTTFQVVLSPELSKTSYGKLAGRRIALPEEEEARPNIDALESHYRQCWWNAQPGESQEKKPE